MTVAPNPYPRTAIPRAFGDTGEASNLTTGYSASFIKANSGKRRKGKHMAFLMQYSMYIDYHMPYDSPKGVSEASTFKIY